MSATDFFKKGLALSALTGLSYTLAILRNESIAEGTRADISILIVSTLAFPSFTLAAGMALNKARRCYADFQANEPSVREARKTLDAAVTEVRRIKKIARGSKDRNKEWRRANEKVDVVARQAAFTLLQDEAIADASTEAAEKMTAVATADPLRTPSGETHDVRAAKNGKESLT